MLHHRLSDAKPPALKSLRHAGLALHFEQHIYRISGSPSNHQALVCPAGITCPAARTPLVRAAGRCAAPAPLSQFECQWFRLLHGWSGLDEDSSCFWKSSQPANQPVIWPAARREGGARDVPVIHGHRVRTQQPRLPVSWGLQQQHSWIGKSALHDPWWI